MPHAGDVRPAAWVRAGDSVRGHGRAERGKEPRRVPAELRAERCGIGVAELPERLAHVAEPTPSLRGDGEVRQLCAPALDGVPKQVRLVVPRRHPVATVGRGESAERRRVAPPQQAAETSDLVYVPQQERSVASVPVVLRQDCERARLERHLLAAVEQEAVRTDEVAEPVVGDHPRVLARTLR